MVPYAVVVDGVNDVRVVLQLPQNAFISDLKAKAAALDTTGRTKAESFDLMLPGQTRPLPLHTLLTPAHLLVEAVIVAPPGPSVWEVVGGVGKGGIIVRRGLQTTSPLTDARLATGSTIEEIELVGERLCYTLLTGTGPANGWVSLTFQGKDLVVKRPPPGRRVGVPSLVPAGTRKADNPLTLELAQSLQQDLICGFSRPEFQRSLQELAVLHPLKSGAQYQKDHRALLLTVQAPILPLYGFEGNHRGTFMMINAFSNVMHDPIVQKNGERLNELIGM
eukprot:NODE_12981_length_1192_cov_12.400939.p1 GENE.NODE_12981_length_1192_cov_12.400939~~NODE_12981_length_1192_cov_12.400939.p1  ORF type:complete len:310 (+),score=76.37 NODE_12981_length_1192_cov_12.400939:99-932(+)